MRRARGWHEGQMPEEVIREVRVSYYGLVSYADSKVGQLLRALEETGQSKHTIVVYTADHGEMLGTHGLWAKSTLFEASAHVPLIVSYPARFPADKRIWQPVSLVDLIQTVVDVGKADPLPDAVSNWDGHSLLPLIVGSDCEWHHDVFSEYCANFSIGPTAMLRHGDFKLIYHHREASELYDLKNDPGEHCDLVNDPVMAQIRDDMQERLLARWDPDVVAQEVHCSQTERLFLQPYMFRYLNEDL